MPLSVSYCESVWASSDVPFHVRTLRPGEAKVFGGGLTLMSLCGQEVAWDVDIEVTPAQILSDSSFACERCRNALTVLLHDAVMRC